PDRPRLRELLTLPRPHRPPRRRASRAAAHRAGGQVGLQDRLFENAKTRKGESAKGTKEIHHRDTETQRKSNRKSSTGRRAGSSHSLPPIGLCVSGTRASG